MKYTSLLLVCVLFLLSGVICSPIVGTVKASPPSQWIDYASNPVFDPPTTRAYYPSVCYDVNQFSSHGAAVYYKMWFNSNKGEGGNYSIGYATSNDGISWTEVMNPVNGLVLRPGHPVVKYDSNGFGSGVYYKIWHWDEGANIYSIDALRYAESSDGVSWTNDQPLTQDDTSKLVTGTWPGWNTGSYGPCDIIYNPSGRSDLDEDNIWNNKYTMYYMGTTGSNEFIGLAYSANGTHWKRYGANPVLEPCTLENDPGSGWDYYSVGYATVIKDSSGLWMMWYCGGPGTNHGIGYATSPDGILWTKDPNNPIFHKNDGKPWRSDRTYTPRVIFDPDNFGCHGDCASYKMWYSGIGTGNYAVGYTKSMTKPTVTTQAATGITTDSATLNGNLTNLGTADNVSVSFQWGATSDNLTNETSPQLMTGIGAFSDNLTGLTPGQTYYFRAKADGGAHGTSYGVELSFATGTTPPTVTTNDATNVEETSATLNGNLSSLGSYSPVYVFSQYGLNASYGTNTTEQEKTATGGFSDNITGLSKGTLYHLRAACRYNSSYTYGDDNTLLTKPDTPTCFTATPGDTQVSLSWTKGNGANRIIIIRKVGGYSDNRTDGTEVYFGTATSYTDTGLTNGTTYYYSAWSEVTADGLQQFSDDKATAQAKPMAAAAEIILTANSKNITADSSSTLALTATVTDGSGAPVADGTEVIFTTDHGILGSSTTTKQTVGGAATANLTSESSTKTIIATVTAATDNLSAATAVFFIPEGGTEVEKSKTGKTSSGNATVNAKTEADTEVTKSGTGTPIITVAKYKSNPGGATPGGFQSTGNYIDVHTDNVTAVDEILIKTYYTNADIAGMAESSLRMRYCTGSAWLQCSDSGVTYPSGAPTYRGYVWAKIRADTTPNLTYLAGGMFTPMGTPSGGGGGIAEGYPHHIIRGNVLGRTTLLTTANDGRLLSAYTVADATKKYRLEFNKGTKIVTPEGKVPYEIIAREAMIFPSAGADTVIMAAYDITAYTPDSKPVAITFDTAARLVLSYDPGKLPKNTLSLAIAYYDANQGWLELEPYIDGPAEVGVISTKISHLSIFTVLVKVAPPPLPTPFPTTSPPPPAAPASFEVSKLSITPGRAIVGRPVTITAQVINSGGSEGSHSLNLSTNGATEAITEISLAPGDSQTASFTVTRNMPGRYEVTLDNLSGEFSLYLPVIYWVIMSIVAIATLIIGITVGFNLAGRRKWLGEAKASQSKFLAIKLPKLKLPKLTLLKIKLFGKERTKTELPEASKISEVEQTVAIATITDLQIIPDQIITGSNVSIIVNVTNNSQITIILQEIELKISGEVEAVKKITFLSPEESRQVTFVVTAGAPGDYQVDIDGLTGKFTVLPAADTAS